jgi:hypothetical protein
MALNIPYKLLDWIDKDKLDKLILYCNPNAITYIKENLEKDYLNKIIWYSLSSGNPNAIDIIEKNLDKIEYYELSANPNAIHILENNLDKVNWSYLSRNPNALHILENNFDKICWMHLCFNENPNTINLLQKGLELKKISLEYMSFNPSSINLLKENPDEINWTFLSSNKNAIDLLQANPDKICMEELCYNENGASLIEKYIYKFNYIEKKYYSYDLSKNKGKGIVELLKKYPEKINWDGLSCNPNAIELLELNQDKINWKNLSINPSIFTFDYNKMKENYKELKKEIIMKALSPTRISYWLDNGMNIDDL